MNSLGNMTLLVVALFLIMPAILDATVIAEKLKRDVGEDDAVSTTEPDYCYQNMPCGWVVFDRHTRRHSSTESGPCSCMEDQQCIKLAVDLGQYSYVYYCRHAANYTNVEYFPPSEYGLFSGEIPRPQE